MRALVVYESMFGNTRTIAEAIAEGMRAAHEVRVLRAAEVAPGDLAGVDVVVVGAPTHVHGLPRPTTRKGTVEIADRSGGGLTVEPGAITDPGVREWLDGLGERPGRGAAFDTRLSGSAALTGRASRGIARAMHHHGVALVAPPESFLVDAEAALVAGEVDRARTWGERLANLVAAETFVGER